jgi:hypothetical protein
MLSVVPAERTSRQGRDPYSAAFRGLMMRSAPKERVSKHGAAASFETHRWRDGAKDEAV